MKKRAGWMPTEMNVGDTPIKDVRVESRGLRLRDGLSVYVFTRTEAGTRYSGQLIGISFLDEEVKDVLSFEFERYLDLNFVMENGVTIDPSLLGDRGPGDLFDVTVAHFLAAKGTLTVERDINGSEGVKVSFDCDGYGDSYLLSAKKASKVFVEKE